MVRHLIVIGASAGGVEAMQRLAAALPADLAAAIFLVIHVSTKGPRLMDHILNRCGSMRASYPIDGQFFEHGQIYVAPPGHQLLLEGNLMRVVGGPKQNRYQPAIDPLFQSAAVHHGARVIGIVLSGYLADGAVGLQAIKAHGGTAIVQHPGDADVSDMPRNALKRVAADYCVPLVEMAPLLERLVCAPVCAAGLDPMNDRASLSDGLALLAADTPVPG